jgi:hypothetical protein
MAPQPEEEVHQPEEGEQAADTDHRLEGEPHHVHRGLVRQRDDVQALHGGVPVVIRQQGQQLGDLDPPDNRVPVVPAEDVLGGALRGAGQALHRRELHRLVAGDVAGHPVTDDDLQRRGHRRGAERH